MSLQEEIAGLKTVAQDYAARFERIDNLVWPKGMRIAVNFTADFDAMLLRRLHNEPPMQLAKGEFGGRVGVWRLIELFDAHGIKATFFTPGRICKLYPRALEAIVRSGHELADHMWEHRVPKKSELERDHLRRTAAALERISGRRPVGSRSHHTPTLLRDEGLSTIPTVLQTIDPTTCWMALAFHASSNCRSTSRSMTRCSSASPGTRAPTASNASPTPTAYSTCGGQASFSSIGRGDTSTSPASLRIWARPAHCHAGSPHRADEDAARCVVCHVRGCCPPLSCHASAETRCGLISNGIAELWVMPWKDRYTISDEIGLADGDLRWPDGGRCAVHIVVDLSVASGPAGIQPRDITSAPAAFAAGEGLDLVLAALARHGLEATFAVPAVIAEIYPDRIKALIEGGHEVAAHGFKHEDVSALSREEEKAPRADYGDIDQNLREIDPRVGSRCPDRRTRMPAARSVRTPWIC